MPIRKKKEDYDLLSQCAEEKILRFFLSKEQWNDVNKNKQIAIEDEKEDDDDLYGDVIGDNKESSSSDSSSDEDSVRSNNAGEMEPIIAQSMKGRL